jgi:hypothetical protein
MRMVALVVWLIAAACGSRPALPPRASVIEADRFPHAAHTSANPRIAGWNGRGLRCEDCHDAAAVAAGKLARPGAAQHAPCDDCHRSEFEAPPGKLCRVCHVRVDPLTPGGSPLVAYPERGVVQALASTFSHRVHLDKAAMENATGHHVACADCHARDAQSRDPMLPGHAACVGCHEQNARVKSALAMTRCAACHPRRDVELKRGRIFITGDLSFHHATHETDRAGAAVPCAACHTDVDRAASRSDMVVPAMERCAQCHEDGRRSPDRVRMENCGTCHTAITSGDAPVDHKVTGALPTDHTLAFRRDHARQAIADDANCRFCHRELSGRKEDSCFQCHNVTRPRDHNLVFRDDHGRDAEADSARCATCHAPETCVACHSVPPPSHTPLDEFRRGGHAQQARLGLTACMTCHTYGDTCSQCHRGKR